MKTLAQIHKAVQVPKKGFKLEQYGTNYQTKNRKSKFKFHLKHDLESISKMQNKLYAEDNQSLLIILQGMDTSGKDGTIKYLLKGINPQGVMVSSFKHPSTQELEHDYLWRHSIKLPEHGQIAIFNRSQYENVLISKVHPNLVLAERLHSLKSVSQIDEAFWQVRYQQIINFEKNCIETGTHILKFFLHISKAEQGKRFIERIVNADKHWKFSKSDIVERTYWSKYQKVYQEAIHQTNSKEAPWFVIPADDKNLAHVLIGKIILKKLQDMNPKFPNKSKQEIAYMKKSKMKLEQELAE